MRASPDLQFGPLRLPEQPPPKVPGWLEALGRILRAIFEPIGRLLGLSWPVLQWILLALLAAFVLFVLWQLVAPLVTRWRARAAPGEAEEETWQPVAAEAQDLLEDADRLAAQGHYGEAAHLLLRRSVGQIGAARPEWIVPASTAREIAALPMLPDAGRRAFSTIAARVERAIYALRDLDAADWAAARSAYADFARLELRA